MPSWRYMVDHGATTIWERWDGWTAERGFASPWMNSFNHYSLGSVGEWLSRFLLGIDQEPGPPASASCCSGRTPAGHSMGPRQLPVRPGNDQRRLETRPRPVHLLGGAAAQRHGHHPRPQPRYAAEVRDAAGNPPSALASYPGAADAQEAVFQVGSGAHEFSGPGDERPPLPLKTLRRIIMRHRRRRARAARLLAMPIALLAGWRLSGPVRLRPARESVPEAGSPIWNSPRPATSGPCRPPCYPGASPMPAVSPGRARRRHVDRDVGQRPGHCPARLRRGGRRGALPRRRVIHRSGARDVAGFHRGQDVPAHPRIEHARGRGRRRGDDHLGSSAARTGCQAPLSRRCPLR